MRFATIPLFALLGLTACASLETDFHQDDAYDWSARETYVWVKHAGDNVGVGPMFRSVLHADLTSKGYRQVETGGDFYVRLRGGLEGTMHSHEATWTWTGPHETQRGELTLEVLDGTTEECVWRGTAKRRFLADQSAEDRAAMLEETLETLLAEFPSKS